MRLITCLFILGLGILSFTTFQHTHEYPQDYFRSPVDHTIYLSGTFGELRPGHFHAGIDIKSRDGGIGQPLYAIAEGYVARIKVSAGGYGNVLYINHPNGYTSVYAHLDRFPDSIAAYVKEAQYRKQSFEIELFPNADLFSFAKGEVVGWMGLSGRSFGPHLHFEIRDTRTEKPINPLLFGINIKDNIAPRLHQLKVYGLNPTLATLNTKTYNLQKSGNRYSVKGDTLILPDWRVGFAIKAYDQMNRTSNWNGVYTIDMFQNDSLWYNTTMETFSFDETRYINAHLDYEEQVVDKSYFNRCYQLPGNGMNSIYHHQAEAGVVELSSYQAKHIRMLVKDVDGNTATLDFWARRGEVQEADNVPYNYVLLYDEDNIVDNGSMRLFFPKGALYENLYMQYQASFDESADVFSTVHHIHDYKTPVHTYFDLSIRPHALSDAERSKLFIAYCDKDNTIINCGGTWKGNMLHTKVNTLGDYCIMKDETPPDIRPVRFSSNMRGYRFFSFEVEDDLPTARNMPDLQYEATIDDQWVLMEYDAKKKLLKHTFDERTPKGEHLFRLIVSDVCGNTTMYERTFVR